MPGIKLTARQVGTESTKNIFSGAKVKTGKVHTGTSSYEENTPDESVNINIGVFFDGTGNNRQNVLAGLEYDKKKKGQDYDRNLVSTNYTWYFTKKEGSFDSSFSNVARMEPYYSDAVTDTISHEHVYIEGIGTKDGASDDKIGSGLGKGWRGIKAKVDNGCENISIKIKEITEITTINLLTLDVYGFSRGAAAARNFIHEVYQKKGGVKKTSNVRGTSIVTKYYNDYGILGDYLAENGLIVNKLVVRFVGLYDTVAAYSIDHDNNTKELHLNAVRKANYSFQLAADDEHRENFRLTNIKSAGGKGLEKTLPGVHSDIGGGYKHAKDETVVLEQHNIGWFGLADKRQEFIDEGWYKPSEIKVVKYLAKLEGTRKGLSNKYSLVPLQIMSEYSEKKKVDIGVNQIKRKYSIKDKILKDVKLVLDQYVRDSRDKMSWNNSDDRVLLKELRHDYFHFSANYKGIGMDPNKVKAKRKRVIDPG